jgi:hypothetical protein
MEHGAMIGAMLGGIRAVMRGLQNAMIATSRVRPINPSYRERIFGKGDATGADAAGASGLIARITITKDTVLLPVDRYNLAFSTPDGVLIDTRYIRVVVTDPSEGMLIGKIWPVEYDADNIPIGVLAKPGDRILIYLDSSTVFANMEHSNFTIIGKEVLTQAACDALMSEPESDVAVARRIHMEMTQYEHDIPPVPHESSHFPRVGSNVFLHATRGVHVGAGDHVRVVVNATTQDEDDDEIILADDDPTPPRPATRPEAMN